MIKLFKQYYRVISYLFFGVLTTVINIGVFAALQLLTAWNYQVETVIAWFLSVLFAYITNKLWVFSSHTTGLKAFFTEMSSFFFFRLLSLVMELVIMWIGVSLLKQNAIVVKVVDNVVVIVANYVFSKVFIFRKR
ncbi:GtrA family protein [Loigolactobacillus bifermentans]|uniref:GtcA family membrane protein n=1 Tax=Loigolactobacillus bifermentans DSM 20003 TaxID=1423726 RepID=A0A0R1H157_9LACO|nr:GtrA family protein [Loigolactobacillus bifermentans]KRK40206.1 GtcA family membrane protein [Loigolactobacillus bifermentans DSM 20003]